MIKNKKLVTEGALLFISTLVVNAGNYGINLLLGRWMDPSDFSEVMLLVTLLLVLSFIALGFQLTAAKFVAEYEAEGSYSKLASMMLWMRGKSFWIGLVTGLAFVLFSEYLQRIFQMNSPIPFILFGLGIVLYFKMSLNRGYLQGKESFKKLAFTYQVEMWSRLVLTVLFVMMGWGVNGVALAMSLSLILTYFSSHTSIHKENFTIPFDYKPILAFFTIIIGYECSQILINNSDTILVKYFFDPHQAGLYGALALIGRIVYFGTWTVVTILFPVVIKLEKEGKDHVPLFLGGLTVVGIISAGIVAMTYLFPNQIVGLLFGGDYLEISPLLWRYGIATGLFAMANVFVYYNLSLDRLRPAKLALIAGILQVILISVFHASFIQIIDVQIYLMGALLVTLFANEFLVKPKKQHSHA